MPQRTEQITATLQRAIQSVLSRGLSDPRVRGLVSVTKVEISDDLANATVYVSVLPAEHGKLTIHGLAHAAARIRRDIGQGTRMKRVPNLHFALDDSMKKMAELDAALGEATEDAN